MSVYGKFLNSKDNYDVILKLINNIYKSDMRNSIIDTIINKKSLNVVIYSSDENKAVATGCLSNINNIYTISNVIVLEEEQNKGYDELTTRMLSNKAFNLGANEVFTYVPLKSVNCYKNIGFEINGNSDCIEGLQYVKMKLNNENFYNQCDKKHQKMSQKF